mgnify:FL=1|tara:strand:- start:4960 stop:5787 length:828 start_codon:yes stop_codon:yes gene_type:complete
MVMKPTTDPMMQAQAPELVSPAVPDSVSLDLPPAIETLITMPAPPVSQGALGEIPTGVGTSNPQYPALDFRMQPMVMQEGGMVPTPPAGLQPQMAQGPMNPAMMDGQVNQTLSQNPEIVARIRAAIEAGVQSGELDINELNMIIQLAKTVQQNPAMYPQIRQMAIQRGLIPAEEIPEQYDEGLITAIIMAAKAMEADVQIESAEAMQPQPTQMMNEGGVLIGPSHAQGGIPVKVAGVNNAEMEGGEYVIPKNVVKAKGTEFFDKMLKQYEEGGEV